MGRIESHTRNERTTIMNLFVCTLALVLALAAPAFAYNPYPDRCRSFPMTLPDGKVVICVQCGDEAPQCY